MLSHGCTEKVQVCTEKAKCVDNDIKLNQVEVKLGAKLVSLNQAVKKEALICTGLAFDCWHEVCHGC